MTTDSAADSAAAAARQAGDHPVVTWGARLGYAANGIVHLLLGWLALQLAWGASSKDADQSGAFAWLASTGVGRTVLVASAVAFGLLAVWQLTEAIRGPETTDRLKAAGKLVAYLAVGWSALSFVLSGGSDSEEQSQDFTATVLGWPGGVVIVALIGLLVVGVGGYHVYKGWTRKFREDLVGSPGESVEKLAMFGYIAKGIALIVVGGLFGAAALSHDAEKAGGLDAALKSLLSAPGGQIMLTVVALGLVAYGIYSFARAKYARI